MRGRKPEDDLALARSEGRKLYVSSRPCVKCSGYERYTANRVCRPCLLKRRKREREQEKAQPVKTNY